MKPQGIKIGGRYRHYKNRNIYKVLGLAKHSETLEDLVVYEAQYDTENKLWVRPAIMFMEEVEYQGRMQPRFEYISEEQIEEY